MQDEETGSDNPEPDEDAIVIRTVPDEMRYDIPTFTVQAGQAVKVWFENEDWTPHNIVVGEPGSLDEIGAAADALGADGFAAAFIPESDKIIIASKLLGYQKYEILEFTAPMEAGDYDVLCTFPGHRVTMNAVMRVVK